MTSIDLGDLTPNDVGRTVTIAHAGTAITGPLLAISVDTDWIALDGHAEWMLL